MPADDANHISGQLTPIQIGEAIRRKKFGIDMREAIAQGFEYFQGLWEKLDIIDSKYSEILQDYQNLDARVGDCEKSISAVKKQLSDYIDTQDNLNKNYDQRLRRLEAAIFNAEYINDTDGDAEDDNPTISQDINDTNVVNDDDALIIEEDQHSLPSDVN